MPVRTVLILALAGLGAPPAMAEHHLTKRALQEARCIPATLKEVSRERATTVYEARCKGARRRTLVLVCTPSGCAIDDHGRHDPAEEDGEPDEDR